MGGYPSHVFLRGGWGSAGAAGSRGMWARNSLRGGRTPSTLLWEEVCWHKKLSVSAVGVA